MKLSMYEYLLLVEQHGIHVKDYLRTQDAKYPAFYAKAEKAARKGYTDYGVVSDRPWLTPKGKAVLARWKENPPR